MAQDQSTTPSLDAAVASRLAGDGPAQALAARLFGDASPAEARPLSVDARADIAFEAARFLRHRRPGSAAIRVRAASYEIGGAPTATTVVEIANDDMPFLVDSVLGDLQSRGLAPAFVAHPILRVGRDADGTLTSIEDPGRTDSGTRLESFILLHLPVLDTRLAAEIEGSLATTLSDVRLAVGDWQAMLARLDRAIEDLARSPAEIAHDMRSESLAFARWIREGHFTLLGARDYRLDGPPDTGELHAVADSSLGVLRNLDLQVLNRPDGVVLMTPEIRAHFTTPDPLILTKSSLVSRVHRRTQMDYIGFKTYGADGAPDGELRLVGLFTSQAYTQAPGDIPLLRRKVAEVVARTGFIPGSHDAKTLVNILATFPRDELFRIDEATLERWAKGILDLDLRPRVRVFLRHDRFERFASVLVFIPRERFSTLARECAGAVLERAIGGPVQSFTPFFPEGPLVRVHFIVARGEGPRPILDEAAIESEINAATRTWPERLQTAAETSGLSASVFARYRDAFPPEYPDTFSAERAVDDIHRIERLSAFTSGAIDFYRSPGDGRASVRAVVLRRGQAIALSERVPVLENFGFRVIDERSYRIEPDGTDTAGPVSLHDMLLELHEPTFDLGAEATRLEHCFAAVLAGQAESDLFNRLVIAAGATWQECAILRALYAYMRQIRMPFGQRYAAETLSHHGGIARDLIEFLHLRFDPAATATPADRERLGAKARERIVGALARVESLDEDRILRSYLNLAEAIVRTNAFEAPWPDVLVFKIDSKAVDHLPEPRPHREIWLYSPRLEGIHLRFAPIARGGIRWSDRAQDFRTEVLGLCKAQQVKNTVIVPSGAKGGFVPKMLPRNGTRDDIQREGVAVYKQFIAGLLSITDNIVEGRVVAPPGLIRHDGDDPYLVVAADKGTATFSDFANELSVARGFWLGDAFASGGSAGYDHKRMGITARGAWECVKRHFRELDMDIQTQPFRVIGVGDMSGDVFGNGMLLSPAIRLIAAFDHRDIFIDPNPDPAATLAERQRLFALPRSSWKDFDASLISAGGGVFPRSAKSIPLSPVIRAMIGRDEDALTPAELINALLKTETDLLWFGGIGTYVRASTETDEQAGDKANDAVRITAAELRCKVIGEGANLGITQRGRIEAGLRGIKLNADFIDNSAGVNTSDEEVNIKIALTPAVKSGALSTQERLAMLAAMTDDVAAACLANNYQQSLAISLSTRSSAREIGYLARLARVLESRGLIERRLEALPTGAEFASRQASGAGLTRPEISILLSWAKIALNADLLAGHVPDDPALTSLLEDYFPPQLRQRTAEGIARHPLRREILATRITNSIINRGGPAIAVRLADETGRSIDDIAYAFLAARAAFGLPDLWARLDALDLKLKSDVQLDLYAETQMFLVEATSALLRRAPGRSLTETIAVYRPVVEDLASLAADVATPGQKARATELLRRLEQAGVPASVADRISILPLLKHAPAISDLASSTGRPLADAARSVLGAAEYFRLGELETRARGITASDYYDRLALNSALGTLEVASRATAAQALQAADSVPGDIAGWAERHGTRLGRAKAMLDEIAAAGDLTVSRLTVAAAQVRELAG